MSGNHVPNGEPNARSVHAGVGSRFERRWHVVGAGLSNVWRFGDLELPAASGRLLLRGPNGTGKTTALEALAPYLLDLNAARMSAGKARTTNLSSLMREGAAGKRRVGYAWLTLAGPSDGTWSFGVRIQYSEGASPPAKVIPFAAHGRPLHELNLYGSARAPLSSEQFAEAVAGCGGQVFEDEDAYVASVAVRLFGSPDREEVAALAGRLRQVRNPTLLGDVSPQAAADALRASLPGVAEDVISATADALAESDATREAFARDKGAAELLAEFRTVWCAHATEVVASAHIAAADAARDVKSQQSRVRTRSNDLSTASMEAAKAKEAIEALEAQVATAKSEIDALEKREAYRDAGRLSELKKSARAQSDAAEAAGRVMDTTAVAVARECDSVRRELEQIVEDLREYVAAAKSADAEAEINAPAITWTLRPRPALRAGEVLADPGAELVIQGDAGQLRDASLAWLRLAETHAARSDAATLAITDHRPVDALEKKVDEKTTTARRLALAADDKSARAKTAEAATRDASRALIDALRRWTTSHATLAEGSTLLADLDDAASPGETSWNIERVDLLVDAEPAQVLAMCERWARHAVAGAEGIAGDLRAQARQHLDGAASLRDECRVLREEAKELRDGRLLPLPRPEWAGSGDDEVALGAVLDWPAGFDDPRERALVEAAMAEAGLLGASLSDGGVTTDFWRVEPAGPQVVGNLGDVLVVDATSPLASVASAVLARVRLSSSASVNPAPEADAALCIGRDGTFSAGVLRGRVPGADTADLLPTASHIGGRQRRAAAIARAEALEVRAAQLEESAAAQERDAARLQAEADAVSAAGRAFPSRDSLRGCESHRAEVARQAREAQEAATVSRLEAERFGRDFQQARAEWSERTRSRGLPADIEQLCQLRDAGRTTAEKLRAAASPLSGKLAARLNGAVGRYSVDEISRRLALAEGDAQAAYRVATDTKTALRVLEETAGAAIAEVLAMHEEAGRLLTRLQRDEGPARKKQIEATDAQATARANLEAAELQLREALPKATERLNALRALLGVPGVVEAVLDGEIPAEHARLLDQVSAKLHGRKTMTMKTVRERADAGRAKLAGIWSIDPGDDHGELLTYVLTHRDATYTPPRRRRTRRNSGSEQSKRSRPPRSGRCATS